MPNAVTLSQLLLLQLLLLWRYSSLTVTGCRLIVTSHWTPFATFRCGFPGWPDISGHLSHPGNSPLEALSIKIMTLLPPSYSTSLTYWSTASSNHHSNHVLVVLRQNPMPSPLDQCITTSPLQASTNELHNQFCPNITPTWHQFAIWFAC